MRPAARARVLPPSLGRFLRLLPSHPRPQDPRFSPPVFCCPRVAHREQAAPRSSGPAHLPGPALDVSWWTREWGAFCIRAAALGFRHRVFDPIHSPGFIMIVLVLNAADGGRAVASVLPCPWELPSSCLRLRPKADLWPGQEPLFASGVHKRGAVRPARAFPAAVEAAARAGQVYPVVALSGRYCAGIEPKPPSVNFLTSLPPPTAC